MAQISQDELRLRLKAARALRDLSVKDLAALIPEESRLGERTLRKLESGETALLPPAMRELAAALTVPYEWFTCPDPSELIISPSRLDDLQDQLTDLRSWAEGAVERIIAYRSGAFSQILETIDRVDHHVDARVARLESSVGAVIDLAGERTATEFGSVAEQPARGEAGRAWDGRDRRRRDPGSSGR